MSLREWFESWWPWAMVARRDRELLKVAIEACDDLAAKVKIAIADAERHERDAAAARRALGNLLSFAAAVRRGDVDSQMLPSALDGIIESDPLFLETSDHYGQVVNALRQLEHAENWRHPTVDIPDSDGKPRPMVLQMPMWSPAAGDVAVAHPATIASWVVKFFPDPAAYRAQALKAQGVAGIGHLKPGRIHKACLGSVSRKLGEYFCTKCGRIVMEDELRSLNVHDTSIGGDATPRVS